MIGLGPDSELLAVIGHDHQPVPVRRNGTWTGGDGLLGRMERDQVAQQLAAREDADKPVLLFGQVIAVELVVAEPGHLEMKIIDHHVVDARGRDVLRHLRLPDPLGKPHALRRRTRAVS